MLGCGLLGFIDDWSKVVARALARPAAAREAVLAGRRRGDVRAARRQLGGLSTWVQVPLTNARLDLGVLTTVVPVGGYGDRGAVALPRARLHHGHGHEQRREPHRRSRRPGRRHGDHRHAGLRRHRVSAERAALGAARGRRRRRVHRLSLVQQLSRRHLHGRHRLARPRRADRRAGRHHQDRAAASRHRRHLRRRDAVGRSCRSPRSSSPASGSSAWRRSTTTSR